MCCKCNHKLKIVLTTFIFFLIIALVIISINYCNKKTSNILVAIAKNGDNTTLGTTTIKFSQNELVEGTAISHQSDSDEININETGIYQVSYQLFGVQTIPGTFNFNAVLLVNDQALEDTFNQSPVIRNSSSNRMTLTGTIILELEAGDILKLSGVSIEDISYDNARIDIEKIG